MTASRQQLPSASTEANGSSRSESGPLRPPHGYLAVTVCGLHAGSQQSPGVHRISQTHKIMDPPEFAIFADSDALAVNLVDRSNTAICRLPRLGSRVRIPSPAPINPARWPPRRARDRAGDGGRRVPAVDCHRRHREWAPRGGARPASRLSFRNGTHTVNSGGWIPRIGMSPAVTPNEVK